MFTENEIGKTFSGSVLIFNIHAGLGQITLSDERIIDFHCINIVDGSRNIEISKKVSFELFYHPRGRYEAKNIK